MEYQGRYFYGEKQNVKMKLYGAMVEQLHRLCTEDRREINNEISYLLGCKLEGIDHSRKRRAEREKLQEKLVRLENEAAVLWRAILMAQRPKELDGLLPELRELMTSLQSTRQAIENIPTQPEPGEPGH